MGATANPFDESSEIVSDDDHHVSETSTAWMSESVNETSIAWASVYAIAA